MFYFFLLLGAGGGARGKIAFIFRHQSLQIFLVSDPNFFFEFFFELFRTFFELLFENSGPVYFCGWVGSKQGSGGYGGYGK